MAGLGWLFADDLPTLTQLDPDAAWPADTPDGILRQLADLAAPVLRGLLLAGYRPYRFSIARAGIGTTVSIDDTDGLVDQPVQLDPFPSAGAGIVVSLSDLSHDRGKAAAEAGDGSWLIDPAGTSGLDLFAEFSHAIAVPSSNNMWAGLQPGRFDSESPKQIELWSLHEWLSEDWLKEISDSARQIGADLATALARRFDGNLAGITPRGHAGLLWLANPLFWYERDVTFPGQEFDPDKLGEPDQPLPWPQATSAAADGLDPLAVERPGDLNLDVILEVAGQAWAQLATRPDDHFADLVLDENTRGRAHTLAHVLSTGLGLGAVSRANRMSGAWLGYGDQRFGAHDDAVLLAVQHAPWIQALLMLADSGLINPAGYPTDLEITAPAPDDGVLEVEPVIPVFHARIDDPEGVGTAERIVLELFRSSEGVPVATIVLSSSQYCLTDIVRAVAWDYIPGEDGGLMTVLVVAGPGVAVLPDEDLDRSYHLQVFRVWNYESVPPRGARVQPEMLVGGFVHAWQPQEPDRFLGTDWPDGIPMNGFTVFPLPDGVCIEYPTPQFPGRAPRWRLVAQVDDVHAHDTRIAYSIVYGHRSGIEAGWVTVGEPSIAQLALWVAGNVTLSLEYFEAKLNEVVELSNPEVRRIEDPMHVPLQGAILETAPLGPFLSIPPDAGPPIPEPTAALPLGSERVIFPPPPPPEEDGPPRTWTDWLLDFIDLGVGFIPLVGDAVDVADLVWSFATGTDHWGRPVTKFDQMIMATAILVPFGSSAALRALGRTGDDIVGLGVSVSRSGNPSILDYLSAASSPIPQRGQRALRELAETSPHFHRLEPDRQQRVLDVLKDLPLFKTMAEVLGQENGLRFAEEWFDLIDLLDDTGLYPWLPGLQDNYRMWLSDHGHLVSTPELLQQWIVSTTGPPRAVLEALFGADGLRFLRQGDLAFRPPKLSTRYMITNSMNIKPSVKGVDFYATQGVRSVIDALEHDLPNQFLRGDRLADFVTASELPELIDLTITLLRKLSPTNDPDAVALAFVRELMGLRTLEPDDLGEMLLRSCKFADDRLKVVTAAARAHSGRADIGIRLREYLELAGHRSVFQDVVTQSGVQWGGAMEVTVGGEEFLRLLLAGESDPVLRMTLQNAIGATKGPDLVRVFEEMLQIVDSKAVLYLASDAYAQSKVLAQASRWVDLRLAQVLRLGVPDGIARPMHWEMIFRTDSTMFIEHAIRRYKLSTGEARDRFLANMIDFENFANDEFRRRGVRINGRIPRVVLVDTPLYIPYR